MSAGSPEQELGAASAVQPVVAGSSPILPAAPRPPPLGRALALVRRIFTQERVLFAIFVLGCCFRAWQIMFWRGPLDNVFSDAGRHLDNARHFLTPGPMGCSNAYFPQLFLYTVIKYTKEAKTPTHLVWATLAVLHPVLWYRAARLVVRRVNALRFALMLTIPPTTWAMYHYFMNETILLPLLGGAVWASLSAIKHRSTWRILLATVLWTAAILSRSAVLALAVPVMLYVIYRQFPTPRLRRPLLVGVTGMIAAAGIWVAAQHSVRIFQYATPFGDNTWNRIGFMSGALIYQVSFHKPNSWTYTYGYSAPSFYISPFDPFYEWKTSRAGTYPFTIDVDKRGKDLDALFWQLARKNWKLIPRLIKENLIFLTFGHEWPESGQGHWLGRACLQERWMWAPILLVTMTWALAVMWRRRTIDFVPAMAVYFTAVHYAAQIVTMEGRFRKPFEPFVLLALFWLIDRRRQRQPLKL